MSGSSNNKNTKYLITGQTIWILLISVAVLAVCLFIMANGGEMEGLLFILFIGGMVGTALAAMGILGEVMGQKGNPANPRETETDQQKPAKEQKSGEVSASRIKNMAQYAVSEHDRYLNRIQELNDLIPGEAVSRTIDRIKERSQKIFEYAQRNPKRAEEMQRFMDFYLPATLKLMEQYYEFDSSGLVTKDIAAAKGKIESVLNSLTDSFDKMLESLLLNKAIDVAAEIRVLEYQLSVDGYTKDDFKMG